MYFRHAPEIRRDFPELVCGIVAAEGLHDKPRTTPDLSPCLERAASRLATSREGEMPEIQAWRRVFAGMGLKPTQYRCAAEALLRRYRQDASLPAINPLVDLCNALSLAHAIPVAAFDRAKLTGGIEVRHADGSETYTSFSGETERPDPGEVIFADEAGQAHARRWAHRQSGLSAVGPGTREILVVAEAHHEEAERTVASLIESLAEALQQHWTAQVRSALLSRAAPRFDV